MRARLITDIDKIIIHCSMSSFGDVETIRHWHLERGWDDIGYHFVIQNGYTSKYGLFSPGFDGKVQVGRAMELAGAHCYGQNSHSVGVCLVGDRLFSPNQLFVALPKLINDLRTDLGRQLKVLPHHSFSENTCPNIDGAVLEMIEGLGG